MKDELMPSANADDQPVIIVSPLVQASASQGAVLCYVLLSKLCIHR